MVYKCGALILAGRIHVVKMKLFVRSIVQSIGHLPTGIYHLGGKYGVSVTAHSIPHEKSATGSGIGRGIGHGIGHGIGNVYKEAEDLHR